MAIATKIQERDSENIARVKTVFVSFFKLVLRLRNSKWTLTFYLGSVTPSSDISS